VVLGLGNPLLGDDGAGLLLLSELQRDVAHASACRGELQLAVWPWAEGCGSVVSDCAQRVEFLDGGTQGLMLLGRVARRNEWIRSYPVKLRLARHPHTPRLVALACVRQLFLFDLARVSLLPTALAEVRRVAEDLLLNQLSQLPLGQKITLAKQGPPRVAAALPAEGLPATLPLVLENAHLNETQITRVLTRPGLSARVVGAISRHPKWSISPFVRIALIRHPLTPLARVMTFLPDIPLADLRDLLQLSTVRPDLRRYLAYEVARRAGKGREPAEH